MSTAPSAGVNGLSAATAQSNQDLLAEIFGSSSATSETLAPSQQKSTVDDILSLFGSSSQTVTPVAVVPSTPFATATSTVPATPASTSPPTITSTPIQPPSQRLTAYPAYEKNGLRITLTPQTSPTRPGVVMILARFQVTGSEAATGLSFQAAVPKVCLQFVY